MTSVNVTENKYSVSVTEGVTTVVTVKAPGPQGVAGAQGPQGPQGPAVSDGDKGDIVVSNSGATYTVDNGVISTAKIADDAVSYSKIQNVSATDRILGRDSSGAGVIEEITPGNVRTMINVEDGATADQTASEIKTAYESNSDTNAFTDADHTKLDGIEANADVTDGTNVNAAGAVMNSDLDGKGELLVGDGSGDPTALAVGADGYVLKANSSTASGLEWSAGGGGGDTNQNAFSSIAVSGQTNVAADSVTDTFTLVAGANVTITTDASNDSITIASADTNTQLSTEQVQDIIGAMVAGNTETNITVTYDDTNGKLNFSSTDTNTTYSIQDGELSQNNFTNTLKTKLDGIAANANVGITDVVGDTSPQLGGSLDVNGQDIVSTSNGDIDLDPNGSGKIVSKGNATRGSGQIKLNCEQNSHGVTFKGPPHSAAADYTFTLPNDIQNGKYLTTDANGNTSWGTPTDTNTTYSVGDGGLTQNNFTDADHTKLDGIAANANNYSISTDLLDEDNMASNSATKVPSQQSVKAYVDANSGGGGGSGLFTSYARLSDTQSSGTQGGASAENGIQTRSLNTEDWDPDNIVTLSSNQFTLGAGTYYITFRVPYMQTKRSQAHIYDVTASAVIQSSVATGYSVDSSGDDGDSLKNSCRVTISSSNVYTIRHYTQSARATYGLGLAAAISGFNEIYTVVEIYKES